MPLIHPRSKPRKKQSNKMMNISNVKPISPTFSKVGIFGMMLVMSKYVMKIIIVSFLHAHKAHTRKNGTPRIIIFAKKADQKPSFYKQSADFINANRKMNEAKSDYDMIMAMKLYFGYDTCPSCRQSIDKIATRCPHCNKNLMEYGYKERSIKEFYRFDHYVQVSFLREIFLFLIGWLGFKVIGAIISTIGGLIAINEYGITGQAELTAWFKSPEVAMPINAIAYTLLAVALACTLLVKPWKEIAHSFSKPIRVICYAIAGFAALFLINLLYDKIITGIFTLGGWELPKLNTNEEGLQQMMVSNIPLSFVIFGLVGPFCEELTYRVGLFSLCGRTKRWVAYVVSALVFGLIHMGWEFETAQDVIAELVALPTYIGAGAIMGFVYEKGGFASSLILHMLNNILSITLTITGANG